METSVAAVRTARPAAESGQTLLQDGRWADARAAFEAELADGATPEALRGMGDALWWLGEIESSIVFHRRAHASFRERGDGVSAAHTAIALAVSYKSCLGNEAAGLGWVARAESVVADSRDLPAVQGWLWAIRGFFMIEREPDLAIPLLRRALDYARATGDVDLELVALGDLGYALVRSGDVGEGLRLVDEAMAGLTAGEYTRLETVVFACCAMLVACEAAGDLARATQWCRVADEFVAQYGCPFLYADCRIIYGSILVARGQWDEAERELMSALEVADGVFAAAHVRARAALADLRLRQGRLDVARALLAGIEHERAAALPAATLAYARGEVALASSLLERLLRHEDTSSPIAARALGLLVEASLACGHASEASAVAQRLEAVTAQRGDEAAGWARMAAGRVAEAQGDEATALACYEQAVEVFARLELPFEVAGARLAAVRVSDPGRPALAVSEAKAALSAFEQLGAETDSDSARAVLRSLGVRGRPGPKGAGLLTIREREVLRLLASGLSNPEIASRLSISRKTAAHHVSSVLGKLDLRNRAEAVAYAVRELAGEHA